MDQASAVFELPDSLQSRRLGRALEIWGADLVTQNGCIVEVTAPAGWIMTLMGLFSDGKIEDMQRGRVAVEALSEIFPSIASAIE